ncbi:MAG: hypothetical protein ABUT20_26715 [Bacteroidota bacterium]
MKPSILLLALITIVISSCTTAYKTGQTPDDVYFSPAAPQDEYVRTRREDDRRYESTDEYYDDRYLRMKVHNRTRWSSLDDWYYFGERYNYGYSYYNNWNNPWNPNTYWNYYYNPYCSNVGIINPKSSIAYSSYNHPRTFNLNTYNGNLLNNSTGYNNGYTNPKGTGTYYNNSYTSPRNVYNSNNNNSNNGNFLRNIFSGSNNRSSSSSSNSSSNSNSSSSSSSSSSGGSSSGSSAPVRRF